ncbi:MAG: HAMP domain-containing histidine kinase [Clostridiales bacterium]|nr:HAMP domain-containing histidine kinase [Clostridiales bacterium]
MGRIKIPISNDSVTVDESVSRRSSGARSRSKIRFKWMTNSIIVTLAVLLVSISIYTVAVSNYLFSSMRSDLITRVNSVASFFNKYANSGYEDLYSGAKRYIEGYKDKNVVELQFLDSSGRLMFSTSNLASGMVPSTDDLKVALSENTVGIWTGKNPSSGEYITTVSAPVVFPGGEVAAVVRCVSSMKLVTIEFMKYIAVALAAAVFVLSFVILSNGFFIRSILSPLAQINDTAMMISQGRYGVHIDALYEDEIGELCETINNMSDAISKAEKTKNDFISSVSHELRTPLTAIAGWSETLLDMNKDNNGTIYSKDVRKGLEIIKDESTRLTRMVEDLLDFSRMESGSLNMQMERLDISPDIEDVVFMYMDSLQKEGIRMEFDEDEDIPFIVGDKAKLKQVFFNVLDNARKHGRDGRRIRVEIRTDDKWVNVIVQDFGTGIPTAELPLVKERFYKGSSKSRGSGIGLAVADEIMKLHGGRLDIESVYGSGTTVTMRFPHA